MKTAISVPDALNENIEQFLKTTKMSRSEFFQRAARAYLEGASAKAIVANLNRVYTEEDTPTEAAFHRAALSHFKNVVGQEEW